MARRFLRLLGKVTSDSKVEWLVVASVVVLLIVAVIVGWISF